MLANLSVEDKQRMVLEAFMTKFKKIPYTRETAALKITRWARNIL